MTTVDVTEGRQRMAEYWAWEQAGRDEERRREVLAHGARHAMCGPGLAGGDWRCVANGPGSNCGTIRDEVATNA